MIDAVSELGQKQMEQIGGHMEQGSGLAVQRSLEEFCSSLKRKHNSWHFLPRHVRAARIQVSKAT